MSFVLSQRAQKQKKINSQRVGVWYDTYVVPTITYLSINEVVPPPKTHMRMSFASSTYVEFMFMFPFIIRSSYYTTRVYI